MERPRALAHVVSFVSAAWISIVMLLVAAVALGAGIYVKSQPAWTKWPEIRRYNEGVTAFNAPPGLLAASTDRPAEYPIERAAALWKVASETTDTKLKSLALYNLGTLMAREAYAFSIVSNPRADMAQASLWLAEAIRYDPANEDAKYNLELVERVAVQDSEAVGAPGPGYAPGAVGPKGY